MGERSLAQCRRFAAVPPPSHQASAGSRLESCDASGDRCLRETERAHRIGERTRVGRGDEGAQIAEVEFHVRSVWHACRVHFRNGVTGLRMTT